MIGRQATWLRSSRWLPFILLVGVLFAAVVAGRFWTLLALLPLLALVGWALFDGPRVQRLAIGALFLSQIVMVITWLRPEEFNYYAYAVVIALVAGGVAALSGRIHMHRMWLFVAWFLISSTYSTIVFNPSPVYALLLVPLGLAGVVTLLADHGGSSVDFFAGALLTFAVLQGLLGVSQTLLGLQPFAAHGGTVYSEARNYLAVLMPGASAQVRMATGTFEHFNGLGALLSLVTPIAFGAWLEDRSARRALALIAVSAGLIATFSRGALLGAAIGSLLIYWSSTRETSTRSIRGAVLGLVGVLSGLALFQGVAEYAAATGNLAPRLEVWNLAVRYSVGDPARLLFGSGYGYFGSGFLESYGLVSRLHSAPVQVLTELGLVGVALFVLVVLPPIRRGLRSSSPAQIRLAGGAIAFLAHQVFDNGLFGFTGLLFFGVVSVLIHYQKTATSGAATTTTLERAL